MTGHVTSVVTIITIIATFHLSITQNTHLINCLLKTLAANKISVDQIEALTYVTLPGWLHLI